MPPEPAWGRYSRLRQTGARALWILLWLTGPLQAPDDPSDLLAVIAAEDVCDLTDRLHLSAAPTLIVGGDRDMPYCPELMRVTARCIPRARLPRLRLYPRKGHLTGVADLSVRREIIRFLSDGPVTAAVTGHRRPEGGRRGATEQAIPSTPTAGRRTRRSRR